MIALFKSQMDYIFFIYGMSFFILAAACLLLIMTQETKLPWFWLGMFGFTHAIKEWLDLFSISIGDNSVFNLLRLLTILLSFIFPGAIFLAEFLSIKRQVFKSMVFYPLAAIGIFRMAFWQGGRF